MSDQSNLKIFIDVNVVLDLLLHRLPFYHDVAQLFTLAHQGAITVGLSAATFPFAFFHLRKATNDVQTARDALKKLSSFLELVAIDGKIVKEALDYEQPKDLEDGVQLAAARAFNADMIVTRDKKGFRTANVPVYSPPEFLAYYQSLDR